MEEHKNQMTNTHLLIQPFTYLEPATVEEALALLQQHGARARLLAGGTHLLVLLKMEREKPEVLISLNAIPGLRGFTPTAEGLEIGALTTIRDIATHPQVRAEYRALAEACLAFGSVQVQAMGTLGGNLCNGSPASDTVPALLIFDAQALIVGPEGERRLPVSEFLLGPGRVALRAGELLRAVLLPPPPEGAVSRFVKVSRVIADLAKANAAVLLVRAADRVVVARLAYGSVAPTVRRMPRAEAALTGQLFDDAVLETVSQVVAADVAPIDDARSTADYRRRLCGAMAHDLLTLAWNTTEPLPALPDAPHPTQPGPAGGRAIPSDAVAPIEFTVNGKRERLAVAPNELLINVLRERLQLTGTKYGCGIGECGACTVEIAGRPALACLTLAAAVAGQQVVTIEGLQQPNGALHPLQQAFIDEAAFQCGYCTPGMIMTAKCLLGETPHPTEAEIRDYLKGNRCRCTGYASIVRAVLRVAEQQ